MIRRYVVELWAPMRCEPAWMIRHSRGFRTRARAEREASRLLARHELRLTRTGRKPRGFYAAIVDAKRGETIAMLDAPHRIVPSVWELGWTP